MMDCKKALNETNGNMDEAIEVLRKNGQAKAVKKEGRIAAEGLCRIARKGDTCGNFCHLYILTFSKLLFIPAPRSARSLQYPQPHLQQLRLALRCTLAAEGLCRIARKGDTAAAVVEVNSETDFVAKNETFQQFVGAVAR